MDNRVGVFLGLLLFAALGAALAWWGWTDLRQLQAAARSCAPVISADSSSFWFLGMLCLLGLPALLIVPDRRHGTLFLVVLAVFLALPGLGYVAVRGQVSEGYDMAGFPPLFSLQAFDLNARAACQPV